MLTVTLTGLIFVYKKLFFKPQFRGKYSLSAKKEGLNESKSG